MKALVSDFVVMADENNGARGLLKTDLIAILNLGCVDTQDWWLPNKADLFAAIDIVARSKRILNSGIRARTH